MAEYLAVLLDVFDNRLDEERYGSAGFAGPGDFETLADLTPADITQERFANLLATAGLTEIAAPQRMAEINTMLATATPALRERLLVEFLSAPTPRPNDLRHQHVME